MEELLLESDDDFDPRSEDNSTVANNNARNGTTPAPLCNFSFGTPTFFFWDSIYNFWFLASIAAAVAAANHGHQRHQGHFWSGAFRQELDGRPVRNGRFRSFGLSAGRFRVSHDHAGPAGSSHYRNEGRLQPGNFFRRRRLQSGKSGSPAVLKGK